MVQIDLYPREETIQEIKMTWKNIYGLVSGDEENKDEEEREGGKVELDNKEDIYDDEF